ncbi:glycosyltransferase family 4 protein [Aquibacillus halophilus]|uniref:glycosyltransferase family 4 protein n=1 Tax=Aquibacillus halophilus TaxID=930132 RepID=UPI00196B90D1|nr:glycosyltransferase family 4 protein [Aquibacillus halophilus]
MKVILATPNFHQPRGNTITVQRMADGLEQLGVNTEIISITDNKGSEMQLQADIVHGFNAYRFYIFLQNLKIKPKDYIVTLTGTDLNYNLFDNDTRSDVLTCLSEAKAIHVFNEEAKETLIKEVPEIKDKTFMIPQGTSEFSVSGDDFQKEPNTFLYVLPAGVRQVKNIPSAIQMLKKLHEKHPHIRLWLVGPVLEEEEGQIVKDLVSENEEWVEYLGQLPHEKMGAVYHLADCILNTSHSEGQSSAILEAMGYGLPVLVSSNEGNKSIVSHTRTGFIYRDTNQFLDYAEQIMNNIKLRQSISDNAKQYIAKHHSSTHEAEYLLNIYQDVLNQK